MKLIITCEHGGNDIPVNYITYFTNNAILKTHRAYDLGALDLFRNLKPLADDSYYSTISRLLVELNRSLHHKNLFSEFTKDLTKIEKLDIINKFYSPYRTAVEQTIKNYINSRHTVIHLSIHSFTPQLNGHLRNCDIGLLYDSSKPAEKEFCKTFKTLMLQQRSDLNIRYNYPYLGKADGFTTYLRKRYPHRYLGIEIEINQHFVTDDIMDYDIKSTMHHTIIQLKSVIKN